MSSVDSREFELFDENSVCLQTMYKHTRDDSYIIYPS